MVSSQQLGAFVSIQYRSGSGSCSTHFAGLSERLEAAISPALLEPDLLAWANVVTLFPAINLQRFELVAVRAKPKRNAIPLAVRLRKRDWHSRSPPGYLGR